MRHFGLMVRDEVQLSEVRQKLTTKYGIELIPGFRCDFRDPFGNHIQVVDLHDESLVWLLPYAEVQKAGVAFRGFGERVRERPQPGVSPISAFPLETNIRFKVPQRVGRMVLSRFRALATSTGTFARFTMLRVRSPIM